MYWIKRKDLISKLYLGLVEGLLDGKSRGEHKAVSSRKTMTGSRLVYTTLRVKFFCHAKMPYWAMRNLRQGQGSGKLKVSGKIFFQIISVHEVTLN